MTKRTVRNLLLTLGILALSEASGHLLMHVFAIHEHISTIFAFAVFLISLLTDGYTYGIAAAFISIFTINYTFTDPYYGFDFTVPANILSAVIMLVISLSTSTLTTKLKQWQSLRAESEKERMRANLLRAVSHDLRTPLTTIYGASSAILDNYETLRDEQKIKLITGIKEDAQWLTRMVENLLSVTRIDSGMVKIHKTPTVLDELIDAVIVKFRKRYPDAPLEIVIPDSLVVIPMDAMLMEQVLINMLENAVQHAEGFTKLSLQVKIAGDFAIFTIADNGCGIPKERLANIFTEYYDRQTHTDNTHGFSGIGLSVCATIVKAHGGAITAENALGGGAVFRFTLTTEDASDE